MVKHAPGRSSLERAAHACTLKFVPEAYSYGFVLWRPKTAALAKFRSLLDYRPEEFLDLVKKLEGETGLTLTGEQYQRKRACPNAAVAPYYNVRGLMMDWRSQS